MYTTTTYIESQFLETENYIWGKNVLNKIFKTIKELKNQNIPEINERCFLELELELKDTVRTFLEKISELPLISKCRVKGDNNGKFGGTECAALSKSVRASCEKYMKETEYKQDKEGSFFNFISLVRDKAKEGELIAASIEKSLKNNYKETGKDDSLIYIQKYGYNFNNLNFKDVINTY